MRAKRRKYCGTYHYANKLIPFLFSTCCHYTLHQRQRSHQDTEKKTGGDGEGIPDEGMRGEARYPGEGDWAIAHCVFRQSGKRHSPTGGSDIFVESASWNAGRGAWRAAPHGLPSHLHHTPRELNDVENSGPSKHGAAFRTNHP